jgi:methylenetetrahydrofolate--tRNA-(uracil-5-)-methyltransferase
MTGVHAAREILGLPRIAFPRESAFGAVVAHLQNVETPDFQPANVTWAPFPALDRVMRDKKLRRQLMAQRALAAIDELVSSLDRTAATVRATA